MTRINRNPEEGAEQSPYQRYKKRAATCLILGSVSIGVPHVIENWETLWTRGVVFGTTYMGFTALYASSGVAKIASSVRRRWLSGGEDLRQLGADDTTQEIQQEMGPKPAESDIYNREDKYLIANGIGAVGMGVTALAATVSLLPPQSWPVPVVAATVDIAASVWSRRELLLHPSTSEA